MNWNARVICWMFFTAPIRRRISRWLATSHSPDRRSGEARPRRCRGPERTHSDVREGGTEGSTAGIVRSIVDLREEGFAEGLDGLIERRGDFVGQVAATEVLEDLRSLGLEEAVERRLELLDAGRRHV